MQGFADLGRVLAGGVDTSAAYDRGAARAAQLSSLIAAARTKQAEAQAQTRLPGALVALGLPADLATVVQGGYNPEQLSGYMGDVQEQGFRGDAVARALAGDFGGANANLFGVANGPQQLATVEGQNLLANRFLPGGGGLTTTQQGQAQIGADQARARASDASAASSYASAARTRQAAGIDAERFGLQRSGKWKPDATSGTGTGGAFTAPNVSTLVAALGGTEDGKPDPVATQDFLSWRNDHPEVRNGDMALAQYLEDTGQQRVQVIDQALPYQAQRLSARIPSAGPGPASAPATASADAPAPVPAPAADAVPAKPVRFASSHQERLELIAAARRAIAQGADRAKVEQRLAQAGLRLPAE